MENNNKREEWIDRIMTSTTGMHKAMPEDGLFEKVLANMNTAGNTKVIRIPVKQWAAAAVILLALNIGSVIHFARHSNDTANTTTTNPLASEIQLGTTYNY